MRLETVGPYSPQTATTLLDEEHDFDALARHGYGNERIDQLVVELLLGQE